MGGANIPSALLAIGLTAGIVGALTLRSSDAVDHTVNTSAAGEHSDVLKYIVDDLGERDDPVVLPVIADDELALIVEFITATVAHEGDQGARWARDRLNQTGLATQCRLLVAANFLDMHSLMSAVMSLKRTWRDIAAIRDMKCMHPQVFPIVVDYAPCIIRLVQIAASQIQVSIVNWIRDRLITGGNVTVINNQRWDKTDPLLNWAAWNNEELVVRFLLSAPGIDVNARNSFGWTPLHCAAAYGYQDIVALLLSAPDVDVDARDDLQMTPLMTAGPHRGIGNLLVKARRQTLGRYLMRWRTN